MALGNSRPISKREDGQIRDNSDRHFHLATRFVCQGMERDEASKKAYRVIKDQEEQ